MLGEGPGGARVSPLAVVRDRGLWSGRSSAGGNDEAVSTAASVDGPRCGVFPVALTRLRGVWAEAVHVSSSPFDAVLKSSSSLSDSDAWTQSMHVVEAIAADNALIPFKLCNKATYTSEHIYQAIQKYLQCS